MILRLTPAGSEAAIEVALPPGASITIGRSPEATVRLLDLSVGRYVVRLTRRPEGVWVEDLASGGGSALEIDGAVQPRPDCLLPDGAVLHVGGVALRVSFG